MDFNGRMSMARSQSNAGSQQRRTQQDESDAFMTLPDREIAGCISDIDIGLPFTVADLQKPNPQTTQRVFEFFAELLTNTTRDVVAPAMRAAAEDACASSAFLSPGDADRVFTPDTRDLMAFFVTTRRLLAECGIRDFSFNDLHKPTRERLVKIFSYIINFIRFRETQTKVIDEHFNRAERTKMRVDELFHANAGKEARVAELEAGRKAREAGVKRKEEKSAELKNRLLELKAEQERVTGALEREKGQVGRLKGALEEKTAGALNARQEVEKLRPYTMQSPQALEEKLRELGASLAGDRQQVETMERRVRALQASADAFAAVAQDVAGCTRLLGELQGDLQREEEEAAKASRHRDALSERSRNVTDVERQERLLQKQLGNVHARTEKLRRQAEERADRARVKTEELRGIHKTLGEERAEKGREMERRRVRIEQVEKKMADLKENIENEIHAAHDEYLKMDSHIKLYITEMDQSIAAC